VLSVHFSSLVHKKKKVLTKFENCSIIKKTLFQTVFHFSNKSHDGSMEISMTKKGKMIKEKVIKTTIELIKEYGDTSMITVRDIAKKAGVGLAMINYHFQTKDNLINECLIKIVGQLLENYGTYSSTSEIKPADKMRVIGKGIAAFMVINPGFSRVVIMNDLGSPGIDDNSAKLAKMFFPVVKDIFGEQKTDQEILVLLHMIISSIEVGFLRRDVIKETMGIDFSDATQRDNFIEYCIHGIIFE
jgi:AcrR family transcriptional regulator